MDHCCYFKRLDDCYIILLLYVDDINMAEIKKLKKQLSKEFAMKDLRAAKQIHSMRIVRDRTVGTVELSQEGYIQKVLSRFNMQDAKPVNTPLVSHFKLSKE